MRTLSLDEERNVERRTARLTHERKSIEKKQQLASKGITLESLEDHDDIVRYFTGLTDFYDTGCNFQFCQHSFTL